MADAQVVSLASRLRSRREELGLSQAQAARELDVARTAYRLWEMEAAKPSPDRWRLIARWLGVSVSTMLLAEDLISDEEARSASSAVDELDRWDEAQRDQESQPASENFYDRSAAVLRAGVGRGVVGAADADALETLLERVRGKAPHILSGGWQRAMLRKDFPSDVNAPAAARAALEVTASDVSTRVVQDAHVVLSELVTNAVKAADDEALPVSVWIDVGADVLRIAVASALAPSASLSREAVALIDAMAERWGSAKEGGRRVVWCELGLVSPGDPTKRA